MNLLHVSSLMTDGSWQGTARRWCWYLRYHVLLALFWSLSSSFSSSVGLRPRSRPNKEPIPAVYNMYTLHFVWINELVVGVRLFSYLYCFQMCSNLLCFGWSHLQWCSTRSSLLSVSGTCCMCHQWWLLTGAARYCYVSGASDQRWECRHWGCGIRFIAMLFLSLVRPVVARHELKRCPRIFLVGCQHWQQIVSPKQSGLFHLHKEEVSRIQQMQVSLSGNWEKI